MAASLHPTSLPFCAVVAPSIGASYVVLQKIEGPVSLDILAEILQKTLDEEGLAFRRDRANREEKIRADRRLREEQDAAYLEALRMDHVDENEKQKNLASNALHVKKRGTQFNHVRQTTPTTGGTGDSVKTETARIGNVSQVTQISLRFPNCERREHSFICTDKIQSIFKYIDSSGIPRMGNYRLISNFPRKVYGVDQMGITLEDAGLHPKASLSWSSCNN